MPYYQVVFKLIPVRLNFEKQIKLNPRRRSLINYFFIIGYLKTLKNPFQSVKFNSELMRYSFIVKLVFIFIQKSPIISGNWERPHGNVKTKSPFIFDVLLCKLIASAPSPAIFLTSLCQLLRHNTSNNKEPLYWLSFSFSCGKQVTPISEIPQTPILVSTHKKKK